MQFKNAIKLKGRIMHTCNHNTQETKAENFLVQGQTGLHSEPSSKKKISYACVNSLVLLMKVRHKYGAQSMHAKLFIN